MELYMINNDFEEICSIINEEALQRKDSQSAIYKIVEVYRKMSEFDRRNVDNVIIKWLWDENRRYDALFLIDEFYIYSLIPELYKLKDDMISPVHRLWYARV